MSAGLHVVRAGVGPRALLVHGSAADHTTWSIQLATLRERFAMIAYDRRAGDASVEDHAADAAALLAAEPGPALVIGSSFGAVIALELIRAAGPHGAGGALGPAAVRGAVLIEPPMAASDDASPVPAQFTAEYDRIEAADGGPAAAAYFLRVVLGEAAYARMPAAFRERATAKWAEIRSDSRALAAYRPRYAALAGVQIPVLLLGGERSAPSFRPTLEALRAALPRARLEIVAGAGHMLHADGHRRFAELVSAFAAEVGLAGR